ncbi:MAG: endonuclease/exonuclease/phosphatase family protein [Christensenellales bacterium]|jgi:endonuclease/exonuclease/phosphatase family metal-dependent hydrolase
MKKIYCILIILCIIVVPFAGCNKETDTSFRVMSFNIRTIASEPNPLDNWSNRKDFVLEVLDKYDADIIGFQELIIPIQFDVVAGHLTGYGSYGLVREGGSVGECTAIFYKKSRFELISSETFWLSETPEKASKDWDAGSYRTCTVVKLKDLITGKEITHYNTHFDNHSDLARTNSVNLVLERMGDLDGVILTGDFNFHEGTDNYLRIISENLSDSKYLAPEDCSDTGGTTHGFGTHTRETPIDYILLTESFFKVNKFQIIRDTDENGRYPSDHFPIYADIDYING